jgi:hypothetical protein
MKAGIARYHQQRTILRVPRNIKNPIDGQSEGHGVTPIVLSTKPWQPQTHLRMDNGPEFIAYALQERCTGNGSATAYIPPGSPWENPFMESFNGRFGDEFLHIELFSS